VAELFNLKGGCSVPLLGNRCFNCRFQSLLNSRLVFKGGLILGVPVVNGLIYCLNLKGANGLKQGRNNVLLKHFHSWFCLEA